MRDHLVLGLGFVLIAINARASEPASGGLEGILDQMETHGASRVFNEPRSTHERKPATPVAPHPTQRLAPQSATPGAAASDTRLPSSRSQDVAQTPEQGDDETQDTQINVFDASRRSALADSPVASGGLEGIPVSAAICARCERPCARKATSTSSTVKDIIGRTL